MKSNEIRDRFLKFFAERGHVLIPSAPVVPENDPSSLFTTAGMQPLVPYLLGQPHPAGARLANVQKCVRTNDIDEVGDATHLTFFQMLGNWSIGDDEKGGYGKKEAIEWSWKLLTDPHEGFGLDPNRLYITVFAGDDPEGKQVSDGTSAPRDEEAAAIWQSVGVPENRIYYLGADSNWWSPGDNGPCGPNSEMFYDITPDGLGDLTHEEFLAADQFQHVVEIWNDVFMEYEKKGGQVIGKLDQKNIDTGAGLERLAVVLQGKDSIYQTDIFEAQLQYLRDFDTAADDTRSRYIICDHLRAAVFMISDGVVPTNTDQGYILRRLLRRVIVRAGRLGLELDHYNDLLAITVGQYDDFYKNLDLEKVTNVFADEYHKFSSTLEKGLRELDKILPKDLSKDTVAANDFSGDKLFKLYSTYGLPVELSLEELESKLGSKISLEEKQRIIESFNKRMKEHQEVSKAGSEQKFKGGLASTDEMSVKYHTATHLLHAALRAILGEHVEQRGSNITPDRLRFDFSHPDKLTDGEKAAVEDWVNDKISRGLPVTCQIMPKDKALGSGAIGLFGDKYGDEVSVYTIGSETDWVSRELCGGPHVENTSELGHFKIKKEEASAAGVRRIKAVLE